jgi:hypothetical protein
MKGKQPEPSEFNLTRKCPVRKKTGDYPSEGKTARISHLRPFPAILDFDWFEAVQYLG